MRGYYDTAAIHQKTDKTPFDVRILASINKLKKERLLPFATVREAWPDEYGPGKMLSSGSESPSALADSVRSLVDISFRETLEYSLASGNTNGLEDLPMFLDKADIVEEILLKQPSVSDSILPLLLKVASHRSNDHSLNLSGYPLSNSQILAIVAEYPEELHALNLSRNSLITVSGIRDLLVKFPSLQRLVLMNCSSIIDAEFVNAVYQEPVLFHNLHTIMHPAFMNIRLADCSIPNAGDSFPTGMSIFCCNPDYGTPRQKISLPFLNLPSIIQGFADLATAYIGDEQVNELRYAFARVLEVAFSTAPREPAKPWGERAIVMPLPLDLRVPIDICKGWILVFRVTGATDFLFARLEDPERVFPRLLYAFAYFDQPMRMPIEEVATQGGAVQEGNHEEPVSEEDESDGAEDQGEDANVNEEDSDSGAVQDGVRQNDVSDVYPKIIFNPKDNLAPFELHDIFSFIQAAKQQGYYPNLAGFEDRVNTLKALMQAAQFGVMEGSEAREYLKTIPS